MFHLLRIPRPPHRGLPGPEPPTVPPLPLSSVCRSIQEVLRWERQAPSPFLPPVLGPPTPPGNSNDTNNNSLRIVSCSPNGVQTVELNASIEASFSYREAAPQATGPGGFGAKGVKRGRRKERLRVKGKRTKIRITQGLDDIVLGMESRPGADVSRLHYVLLNIEKRWGTARKPSLSIWKDIPSPLFSAEPATSSPDLAPPRLSRIVPSTSGQEWNR
jgi:hypothetical protein